MSAGAVKKELPALNPERIPASAQYEIAKATFKAVRRYFEQPEVQERFEAWKSEQARRKAENPEGFQVAKGDCRDQSNGLIDGTLAQKGEK